MSLQVPSVTRPSIKNIARAILRCGAAEDPSFPSEPGFDPILEKSFEVRPSLSKEDVSVSIKRVRVVLHSASLLKSRYKSRYTHADDKLVQSTWLFEGLKLAGEEPLDIFVCYPSLLLKRDRRLQEKLDNRNILAWIYQISSE